MIPPLASALTDALQHSWSFFHKGGIFMIPLVVTALAGLTAIVYKLLSLTPRRVIPPALAEGVMAFGKHIADGTERGIVEEFRAGRSTLARLGTVAVDHAGESRAEVTAALEAASHGEALRLHSGIGLLDIVITVAPLLGLVGTASGLVVIFEGLGETSNHLMISRGIAEALSTTIFGIATAVPAVIAHSWFHRRVEKLSAQLEVLMNKLAAAVSTPES